MSEVSISNFELIKPIQIFDAVWKESDLKRIPTDKDKDKEQFGDVTSLSLIQGQFGGVHAGHQPSDLWGIDWSPIPSEAWNDLAAANRVRDVAKFKVAYLRFIITVLNGRGGDSMLFLYRPGRSTDKYAAVHVEIGMEPANSSQIFSNFQDRSRRRSIAVEQLFIDGWAISHFEDENRAFDSMKNLTGVRFLGLAKEPEIEIHAKCLLLGGMF